ncbi:MAG: glycosyltransferase family 4 protein, partial [Gammaproteobacteria bacterium]
MLYLTSEYPPRIGGVATHVAELSTHVRRHGVEIEIVAPPAANAADYDREHANPDLVRYAPCIHAQPVYNYLLRRWCTRHVNRDLIDLVHVHGLRPLRAALTLGVPVVFTNHTSGFLKAVAKGRLTKLRDLLAGCRFAIGPSEELLTALRKVGYSGPGCYLPNGVDTSRFSPANDSTLRASWGLNADQLVVVIARRMVPKNGVLSAARALALCAPHVRFVFAGDGPLHSEIDAVLRRTGCRDRAIMAGAIANSLMPAVYGAADLCLLPSLMEATSIAGLEAMACGKALIGTRVGGIPALIEDGITGALVPPNDPFALAAAVNAMADDRERLRQMGSAARQRALRY